MANPNEGVFYFLALAVTIASHIPRVLEKRRVLSQPGNFWTPPTMALHVIVATLLFIDRDFFINKIVIPLFTKPWDWPQNSLLLLLTLLSLVFLV